MLVVALPTFLAAIYYLVVAAPLYVTEARFVVRTRGQNAPSTIDTILASVGAAGKVSTTDAFEVQEYMNSRDAIVELIRDHDLRARLDRPESDLLMRFPRPFQSQSVESLFRSYKRFVTVGYDSQTGISLLRVRAFRAADARDIADALLTGGEALVNHLNDQVTTDAVAQAARQVREAETRCAAAETALTRFRSRERIVDPEKSSVANLDLTSKLELQVATLSSQRAFLAASAPQSPQLPVLDRQIAAFNAEIEAVRLRSAGEADSLAPKMGNYERLTLERDIAVRSLASAEADLGTAHLEARRKQLFLERVVNPTLPDRAEEPHRWLEIFRVFVWAMVAWATIGLFVLGLLEHGHK
jgi:capsular polysaccharide transport system permease protein